MELSKEQARWRDLARRFSREEVKPQVEKMERASEFPLKFMKRLGELGILGIPFPKEYGGREGDSLSLILCIQEISKVWASLGLSVGAHLLGANPIFFAGTDQQKKKYLTPLAQGQSLGSFGLTESSSGSDAGSGQTTASRVNGHYALSGKKVFTTSATYASTYIVSAVTDKDKGKQGLTGFILERDYTGLTVTKPEKKLGLWASDTAGLILDNCKVPAENLLGQEGKGFRVFLQTLDAGRLGIAGWCLGIAEGVFEETLAWAREHHRQNDFTENRELAAGALSEMATDIEAAQLLIQKACVVKDKGLSYTKYASMAKWFASTLAVKIANVAIGLIGHQALTSDLPVERFFRDAKLGEIGEGTSEIQKLVIARELLKDAA